jgi:hypothetical protein
MKKWNWLPNISLLLIECFTLASSYYSGGLSESPNSGIQNKEIAMKLFDVVERSTGKEVHSTDTKEDAKVMRDSLSRQAAPEVFQAHEEARINLNNVNFVSENMRELGIIESQAQEYVVKAQKDLLQPLPYFVRKGADHWKLWPKNARISYIEGMSINESKFLGSAR